MAAHHDPMPAHHATATTECAQDQAGEMSDPGCLMLCVAAQAIPQAVWSAIAGADDLTAAILRPHAGAAISATDIDPLLHPPRPALFGHRRPARA
ncbi:MAG: hypothetical protein ACK4YU_03405 [Paracoccus sp. (in: a-proteobacteria)]